jgi:hypothetical protein
MNFKILSFLRCSFGLGLCLFHCCNYINSSQFYNYFKYFEFKLNIIFIHLLSLNIVKVHLHDNSYFFYIFLHFLLDLYYYYDSYKHLCGDLRNYFRQSLYLKKYLIMAENFQCKNMGPKYFWSITIIVFF